MKRIMIVGLLVATTAAGVFANGSKDEVQPVPGYGYGYGMAPRGGVAQNWDAPYCGPGMMYWADEEGNPVTPETVEAEGRLVLEEGTIPYLDSEGGKVFLMIPRLAFSGIEVENGTFVKVSGYDVTDFSRMNWDGETDSTYLRVVSAEIDGKTLVLSGAYGPMGGGFRGGRGHGRW